MPTFRNFKLYLKKHPNYLFKFLNDICKVWWWRILRQPIVVLTTESGGLGDYLWFRSYYSVIRKHYLPKQCRIIVVGMCQWEPLSLVLDTNADSNHFDIYRSFESPDHPLKLELWFFKLFKADVYVNFRARYLKKLINANKYYFGQGFRKAKQYYETANNAVIDQWFKLPSDFKHTPPLLPISKSRIKSLDTPYIVFVEGGNTQGKLSEEQTLNIVKHILSQGFNIFFNGDYKKLLEKLTIESYSDTYSKIIDGYSFPLYEYPSIVANCYYVITVNTFIYHLAIQLEKPCIVLSANEYESVKMDASKQIVLFNDELQNAYEKHILQSYRSIPSIGLSDIRCDKITNAMDTIIKIC